MSESESGIPDSDKVIKAITPGAKSAHIPLNPNSRTEKKIVLNRTSGKLSQRIALERENAAAESTPASPAATPANKEPSTSFPKILMGSLIALVVIGGTVFGISRLGKDDLPPASTVAHPADQQTAPPVHAPAPPPVTTASLAPSATAPPSRGLVAHWAFDGSLDEATENQGKSLTKQPPTFVSGKRGQAIRFDGTDPVIIKDLSLDLKQLQDTFTLCVWVKVPESVKQQSWPAFISRGEAIFRLSLHGSTNNEFHIGLLQYKEPGAVILSTKERDFVRDTWHHVCAVRNADALHLYINGELIISKRGKNPVFDTTKDTPLFIGGNPSFDPSSEKNRNFKGDIDEVLIYNRVLSAKEISELAAD